MKSTSSTFGNCKEMKNGILKQRKKNMLYLILNYIQTEGLFRTAESLISEAHLDNDFQVCDNIDLDIIYQEYCNYYFMKFNKYPKICKENMENNVRIKEKVVKADSSCGNKRKAPLKHPKDIENDEDLINNCMTVNKLQYEEDKLTKNDIIETSGRDIETFLKSVSTEYKSFVRNICHFSFMKNNPVNWDDIIGLDNPKMLLKETCMYPFKYPEFFTGLTSPWKGILLFGPPGVGKTLLVKALVHECDRFFINVTPSSIISKWRGDSEKHVKVLFELARHYAPSIVFIDEIESIASKRDCSMEHDASRRLKTEILIELDGIEKNAENILFLVTSNLPWEIDAAILRRLEKRIYIPLPEFDARKKMFESLLQTYAINENVDFDHLGLVSKGYSNSDIRNVCREACMSVVRKLMGKIKDDRKTKKIIIEKSDVEVAMKNVKPAASYNTEKYTQWAEKFGAG